jgi:hypothetical protein
MAQESDRILVVDSDKERYLLGEQVELSAWLYEGGEGSGFSGHVSNPGNPIDSALVVAIIINPSFDDTTFIGFDEVPNDAGYYRLLYTPSELGSYDISLIATDVSYAVENNDPAIAINQDFVIRAKHSFYVGVDVKPVQISGYYLIQLALEEIQKLLEEPTVSHLSNKEKGKVRSAIRSIGNALDSKNFLDNNRLTKYGLHFYDDLTVAVNYLNELLTNPEATSTVFSAFELLYEGAKIFAEFAIEDAEVGCIISNCDEILRNATSEMGKALREFEKENYQNVFNHLTNAWKFAQNALGTKLKKENSETDNTADLPTEYGLDQNYPNPFNPSTRIDYQLPEKNHVTLQIYDILGNLVTTLINQEMDAGYHSSYWTASSFASGIYIYRFISGTFISTKKLMLMK